MKKIAIVILNWNGAHMMRTYLPTVIKNSPEAEVIIADNASSDDSLKMLASDFPEIRTIVLDKNYGFADGYNKAFKQVEAEYLLLLNSDVDVPEGWLDGVVLRNILEGIGCHCAHALAVHQHLGYGVALIRGDGEGLIPALTDADIAGGSNGAASPGSCLDGVVAVAAAVTALIAACAAIAQNRQRVGFSADLHDNVGCAAAMLSPTSRPTARASMR